MNAVSWPLIFFLVWSNTSFSMLEIDKTSRINENYFFYKTLTSENGITIHAYRDKQDPNENEYFLNVYHSGSHINFSHWPQLKNDLQRNGGETKSDGVISVLKTNLERVLILLQNYPMN